MSALRLAIDLGTSHTVAVVRREAEPRPLLFDGSPVLLRRVVAEAAQTGVQVGDGVVLTCPADWGTARRNVLMRAATIAGLGPVQLVDEPVAAATLTVFNAADGKPRGSGQVPFDGELFSVYQGVVVGELSDKVSAGRVTVAGTASTTSPTVGDRAAGRRPPRAGQPVRPAAHVRPLQRQQHLHVGLHGHAVRQGSVEGELRPLPAELVPAHERPAHGRGADRQHRQAGPARSGQQLVIASVPA